MKKILLFNLLFITSHFILYGQTEKPIKKKNIYLGGSLSINRNETDADDHSGNSASGYEISPKIGYFIYDGLAIGIMPVISQSNSASKLYQMDSLFNLRYNYDSKTRRYGLSPTVRYYFQNGIFVDMNFLYSYNTINGNNQMFGMIYDSSDIITSDETYKTKYHSIGYSLGGGYAVFINSKASVEASLIYKNELSQINTQTHRNSDIQSSVSEKERKLRGLYFSIGFNVFL